MTKDPKTYLEQMAGKPDEKVDVAKAAIALAALKRPGIMMERYFVHLRDLANDVGARHQALLDARAEDSVETQLAALKHVLADQYGYHGDSEPGDIIHKVDMIDVIDRRRGASISLSILYLHAGRAQNWDIAGITIPGHFVLRLQKGGKRVIFDPYNSCRILQAADLRALVKDSLGEDAELSADYYDPPLNLDILKRQQNTIKFRQVEMEDYSGAIETVEGMRIVDPVEHRLLLDAGVLYARSNRPKEAIKALEAYIEQAPNHLDRRDAALLLQHLRETVE
ncbi:MAG: tetratricopeptide repeat protein [Alphaproteobacteria bacterium]|nr:tetratricopeptide repeat protein [Alphaproteobacteria bacterium]